MSSPQPGGGMPRMPRQPGVPDFVVDPAPKIGKIPVKGKKPKNGLEKPFPMPKLLPNRPGEYAPIKTSKAVNKVYKTY